MGPSSHWIPIVVWLWAWFFSGIVAGRIYTAITAGTPSSLWLWGLLGIALGVAKMLLASSAEAYGEDGPSREMR